MAVIKNISLPDIGNFHQVEVIEIMVKPGDSIQVNDALLALESDKAAMEIPASDTGVVKEVLIKIGDKISQGDLILTLEVADATSLPAESTPVIGGAAPPSVAPPPSRTVELSPPPAPVTAVKQPPLPRSSELPTVSKAHASPSVRRFARELGATLDGIAGSGAKGRILKEDVQAFVKAELSQRRSGAAAPAGGFSLPEMPVIDFAQFGEIETQAFSRIKKLSGPALHRSWLHIPHVTQFDEADITDLEAFRLSLKTEAEKRGVKITPLVFLVRAAVAALKRFPDFNASLSPDKESLIVKKYYHIGFAADTPDGLVVPVIRHADQKGLFDIAEELGQLSAKARDGKLKLAEMQGGCFTISSLGGIGGTAFTPIINAPEVAILGVSKAKMQPVWQDESFVPRLTLPLSLSYDHRVIDGAQAARFTSYLSFILSDVRRLLL